MDILTLSGVRYTYRGKYRSTEVLHGIDCGFQRGLVYALVGKSGSGKTTLLSLLAGLDVPTEGSVVLDGRDTRKVDLDKYRRESVSVIYQSFRLFPLLTALENVMYPLELAHVKPREAREKAKECIARVGLPEDAGNRFPGMLSGGEQQRVAIARALAMGTNVLLADEPTGNLDEENGRNIVDILVSLAHNEGYCVIIVTHDLGVLDRMDVVLRMHDGRIEPYDGKLTAENVQ